MSDACRGRCSCTAMIGRAIEENTTEKNDGNKDESMKGQSRSIVALLLTLRRRHSRMRMRMRPTMRVVYTEKVGKGNQGELGWKDFNIATVHATAIRPDRSLSQLLAKRGNIRHRKE